MTFIRHPIAREFYPGDLRSQMQGFLDRFQLPDELPQDLQGAVVPHAGWVYSGQVAARTLYCLMKRSRPETVLLLGTDHLGLSRPTLFPEGEWVTPLGSLTIDHTLVEMILEEIDTKVVADAQAHQHEHAIEVILPMVHYYWPECQIVPITVPPIEESVVLGKQLGVFVKKVTQNIVVVASTDLTHYGAPYGVMASGIGKEGYEWLVHNDRKMIDALCAVDGERILQEAQQHQNACGAGAVAALAALMTTCGHGRGYLIEYATSHGSQPPETFTYGVGYAGVVY